MKIGWKIRKLWLFEVSQIFTKHFLTSRYEYANEWVDDVIASLLAIYFVHTIFNILPKLVIVCPSYQAILELTLFYIYSERNWGKSNVLIAEKWDFLSFLCTKWMENCEAMTSTRSFAYSYRLVKKCFLKICETSKCHNFLIFQPIFIRFLLFCSNVFTLSSEIKLNYFRNSPLKLKKERKKKLPQWRLSR